MPAQSPLIRWFASFGIGDVGEVGGKNASLGELYGHMAGAGVRVPNGFALTATAYRQALTAAGAWPRLHALLDGLDIADLAALARAAAAAREIVHEATGTETLRAAIAESYAALEREYGASVAVAVRSSATAEDLPDASFAGQHESFLNVAGTEMVIAACRRCFASIFTDRAIVYRVNNGFDHFKVALSVGVMKMVRSDQASSGVIFTLDTESGFRDVVLLTGAWGLGENVVQGAVDPDEFVVHKPTYRAGHLAVLRRRLGQKQMTMGLVEGVTRNLPTPPERQARYCLADAEVLELAGAALRIEDHYSAAAGHPLPMDIEWAKDAGDGMLYIVQARPETVAARRTAGILETYSLTREARPLVTGRAVGEKIAAGAVRLVRGAADLAAFRPGEVLVAEQTSPDWEPVMKTAGAIVTDHGGRTCHAAIVARELGVPAVVGAGNATATLRDGTEVTVSCATGEQGGVYAGRLPFTVTRVDLGALAMPKTAIMVNLGNPERAFHTAMLPNAGVGLARMEFVINEHIGIHPMAIVHPERIAEADRAAIAARAAADASPRDFFVRALSEGIGTIAAAFFPRPVIVRLSDFKTNEYAALIGGAAFEPVEANPMFGFRGAARYAHPAYAEGFALE
ncbi:MAG: phosphoenolpyruvate synthase, partial [Rhodospirillales bacterium]|nr:phosphoenolpyruvate synthase [Rhodospirillales bacterium]